MYQYFLGLKIEQTHTDATVPVVVLDCDCVVSLRVFVGREVLILLQNVAAPAVDIDVYGGGVAPDAPPGCKVNFKAKAVAAG